MALFVTRSTRVADSEGPTAPTITATPASTSTISVDRVANSFDVSGVAYYETQRSPEGIGSWTTVDSSHTNPLTVAGLAPATSYDLRQRGIDSLGNPGFYSAISRATTQSAGSVYYGGPDLGPLPPTIYAAQSALGTGSGNSEANATTLAAALALASPGTVIGVVPGVCTGTGRGRGDLAAFMPANSGTASNPIYIVAKYSAVDLIGKAANTPWTLADGAAVMANPNRSELRHDGVLNAGNGSGSPVFGAVNRNYVHWIGFCADEATAAPHSNTGLSLLWGTTGSRIARCVLISRDPGYNGSPIPTTDNHPNVRLESATDCTVEDNVLLGHFAGPSHNHCSVQRYESTGTVVQHNFTQGTHTGIYLKDQDTSRNEIVRFNYSVNPQCGIEILNVNIGVTDTDQVYQNLIVGAAEGLIFQSRGTNIQAHHNTIVSPCAGGGSSQAWLAHFSSTGCYLRESILVGTFGSMFIDQSFRTDPVNVSNHNLYFRTGTSFTARYNGSTYNSLAAWRAATGQDADSVVDDPLFVDQGGGNYRLSGSSPARTVSESGGPAGAYITGIETLGPRYV